MIRSLRGLAVVTALLALPLTRGADTKPGEPIPLTWRLLRGLDTKTGQATPELKKAHGQLARVPGYMVPLEDDAEHVSEFLLVPYVGACIHTPPPPPNQIVHVTVTGGKKVKMSLWDPIQVKGKLEIQTVKSPYGDVSYKLAAQVVEPYKDE